MSKPPRIPITPQLEQWVAEMWHHGTRHADIVAKTGLTIPRVNFILAKFGLRDREGYADRLRAVSASQRAIQAEREAVEARDRAWVEDAERRMREAREEAQGVLGDPS